MVGFETFANIVEISSLLYSQKSNNDLNARIKLCKNTMNVDGNEFGV